jgi:hypothetical protein
MEVPTMPSQKTRQAKISVVPVNAAKICRPLLVEFRMNAPESGYRINLVVEKACSPSNDPIWKLVFDLYKKIDREFVEIVHVSFTAGSPQEQAGVEKIATDGVPKKSAQVLKKEVFPVAKQLETRPPTDEEKAALKAGMSKAAVTAVELS